MGENKAWWQRPSAWMMVAGNLVPLAGVLFFGWQLLAVMLAFWLDNVAIGVFTAGRILYARLDGKTASGRSSGVTRAYAAANFALQYGFVCLVHGLLVGARPQVGGGEIDAARDEHRDRRGQGFRLPQHREEVDVQLRDGPARQLFAH